MHHRAAMRDDSLASTASAPARPRLRDALERGIAIGYGHAYDGVVASFRPHQALMDDIARYVERSLPPQVDTRAVRVADVACGTGTLAFRLARDGYTVIGFDAVEHLVDVARRRQRRLGMPNAAFFPLDIGDGTPAEWRETCDVAISLHTLYWHRTPGGVLAGMRRLLKPHAHAVVLNYAQPARVVPTFTRLYGREGFRSAVHALRWLVPTAIFEGLRDVHPNYTNREELRAVLTHAGFHILEAKRAFLADLSLLAWLRRAD
jgi:2-polyprenyl-3-methyl-5-hydroxy-6-metoxy-1,4-benzoquinol methylase